MAEDEEKVKSEEGTTEIEAADAQPAPFTVEATPAPRPAYQQMPPSQQPAPQPYQQPYPPQSAYAAPPAEPAGVTLSRLLTQSLPTLILLGSLLLLVGMIVMHVADPGDDNYEGYTDAGRVLYDVGLFLIVLPMLVAGVSGEGQHTHIRLALIFGAAIILYAWVR